MHKKNIFFAFAMSAISCGYHLNAAEKPALFVMDREKAVVVHVLDNDPAAHRSYAQQFRIHMDFAEGRGAIISKDGVERAITKRFKDGESDLNNRIDTRCADLISRHVTVHHLAPAVNDGDAKAESDHKRSASASVPAIAAVASEQERIDARFEALTGRVSALESAEARLSDLEQYMALVKALQLETVRKVNGKTLAGILNHALFMQDGASLPKYLKDRVDATSDVLQLTDLDQKKAKSKRLDAFKDNSQQMKRDMGDLRSRLENLEKANSRAIVVASRSANNSPDLDAQSSPAAPHVHVSIADSHPTNSQAASTDLSDAFFGGLNNAEQSAPAAAAPAASKPAAPEAVTDPSHLKAKSKIAMFEHAIEAQAPKSANRPAPLAVAEPSASIPAATPENASGNRASSDAAAGASTDGGEAADAESAS